MSVKLSEPPSVDGTGGAQIDADAWLALDAVEAAACVVVSGVSPGSCNGIWELLDGEALMPPPLPPVEMAADPVAVPFAAADDDPDDGADPEPDGKVDVVTLSGSAPVTVLLDAEPIWLGLVWPLVCACADATPKTVAATAIRTPYRTVISPAFGPCEPRRRLAIP
jgi:hypothetical protein